MSNYGSANNYDETSHPHSELTKKIISCAFSVHNELGAGLNEKLYENALCLELSEQHINFSQQQEFPVQYRSKFIGKLIPDLIAENKVIIETKATESFTAQHSAQLLSYLKISRLPIGLLLNFRNKSLQIKRIANL